MSLRINNNIAAIDSHRNLTNTTMSLTKSMEKLSSGYRINRAADDPAGLVISEQFRAQIAGLNQAIENSEGSINMIQTAEGALNEINSLLVSMRELAIHAANEGFNDTAQLEADQAEINNAIQTIDRIAANPQFGTKKLLDGTKANVATITSSNSAGISLIESGLSTGTHSVTATKTADAAASLNITSFGVSLDSTITPYNLTEGIHNIDVIQASAGASKVSNAVNILDAWGNGLEFAAAATSAQLTSAAAIGAPATASNAGAYTVKLNYQENGQSVAGWQTLSVDVTDTMTTAQLATAWNDAINGNAALAGRVEAVISAGNELVFRSVNSGSNYSVALEGFSTDATTGWYSFVDGDARGASTNELRFDIDVAKSASSISATTTITAGTYTSIDTLISQLETDLAADFGTAATGVNNIHVSKLNDNQIQFTLMDEGSDYAIQLLATSTDDVGAARAALGLVTDAVAVQGTDALVSFDNYTNTISAVNYNSTQSFTLANKAEDTAGRGTIGITIATANQGINLGSMLLDSTAARFDVRLDAGPATAVTAGVDTYVYNADRTESLKVNLDLTSNGGSETISNTDQSLVFQIGANVGQIAKISLPGMSASSLSRNIAGNMFTSLAAIDVTTVEGAQDTQAIIDAAIDQVSTIRGTLGSFQKNTLESNLSNLRIASQNLQSSESTIRDTDMAAEMSVFVKNQILLQAGTAMLAQANQVPQVVLSLFQ